MPGSKRRRTAIILSSKSFPPARSRPHRHSHSRPSFTSIHADRYLLKVLRRARNRFVHHRKIRTNSSNHDNQSDSGIFTPSTRTNPTDDVESNSLRDIDDDEDFSSLHSDNSDNDLLCESLEAALMEALMELRQFRQQRMNSAHSSKSERILVTKF